MWLQKLKDGLVPSEVRSPLIALDEPDNQKLKDGLVPSEVRPRRRATESALDGALISAHDGALQVPLDVALHASAHQSATHPPPFPFPTGAFPSVAVLPRRAERDRGAHHGAPRTQSPRACQCSPRRHATPSRPGAPCARDVRRPTPTPSLGPSPRRVRSRATPQAMGACIATGAWGAAGAISLDEPLMSP